MPRSCLLLVVTLLAAPVRAEEIKVEAQWKTIDPTNQTSPAPVGASSKMLELRTEPPADAPPLPEGLLAVGYTSFGLRGRTIHVVLARSTSDETASRQVHEPQAAEQEKAFDRAAIDRNGDGKLTDAEVETVTVEERKRRDGTVGAHRAMLRDVDLSLDGRTLRTYLMLQRMVGGEWSCRLFSFWYLEGAIEVGGKGYVVNLVDADQDGTFEGPEDLWLVRDAQPVQRPFSQYALSAPGEGRFHDGRRFVLESIQGAEATLSFADAEGPDPGDEAKARTRVEHVWAKLFDKERDGFVAARGLDTSRPRAQEPIRWRYITFAEAKALAARENRPLFVDIMAFWCVWCYRMDYYTYVDAEVARLLNEEFVAVKIIQEQDRADDYDAVRQELDARGIPAMGIWGPDGTLRHKIGGWKKPEDFLADLRIGLKDPEEIEVSED